MEGDTKILVMFRRSINAQERNLLIFGIDGANRWGHQQRDGGINRDVNHRIKVGVDDIMPSISHFLSHMARRFHID